MIRCILALDLKGGIVVRGVRGEREKYRPISETSTLVDTPVPEDVISAIRPKETYIADLDRITGSGNNLDIIESLSKLTRTMSDTGASCAEDAIEARMISHAVILGTETAPMSLIRECQGKRTIVSLDMKDGKMLFRDRAFNVSPLEALEAMNEFELGGVILLDLSRVGSGEGIDPGQVESAVSVSRHDIIVGGGVRGVEDLELIERHGASGAIIASAVHSGKVPVSMLRG